MWYEKSFLSCYFCCCCCYYLCCLYCCCYFCFCFCCCCIVDVVIIVAWNFADVIDIVIVVAVVVVLVYISINFLIFLDPCSPESDWPCAPPVLPYTDYGNGKLRPESEFAFTSHIILQCWIKVNRIVLEDLSQYQTQRRAGSFSKAECHLIFLYPGSV